MKWKKTFILQIPFVCANMVRAMSIKGYMQNTHFMILNNYFLHKSLFSNKWIKIDLEWRIDEERKESDV